MAGPERSEWIKAVEEEYQSMVIYEVFQEVERIKVPIDAKILSSTWAMRKKSNGVRRARINARGYEQVDGEQYDSTNIASPTVNEASMFIILILKCMERMVTNVNDVRGVLLNGKFSIGERLYMEVPEGFERFYPKNKVLLLLKTKYGLKQAAFEYWLELLKAVKAMKL